MKHCLSKTWQMSWMVCLVMSSVLFVFPAFADSSLEKDLVLVKEYQDRISSTTREIYELKENLEWLELKINRMTHLEKKVSTHLNESVAHKKLRIDVLEQDRSNHTQCLEKIKARILSRKKTAAKALAAEGGEPGTEIRPDKKKLIDQIKKAGLLEWFEVIPDQQTTTIKTILPILFPSGSAVISKEYNPFLEKISSFIKDYKTWIVVDGFADKDPIRTKQFPSNFELGAMRAANVVHALVSQGVDPSAFKVSSTGKYRFPTARKMSAQKVVERYVNITICFETS